MTLGQRIALHRGRLQLSQLELAEHLNVSRQSVSKWETDASTPELGTLIELSKLFERTLDELVLGEEDTVTTDVAFITPAPQSEKKSKSTLGIVFLVIGMIGTLIGCLSIYLWVVSLPLLIAGIYLLRPNLAVKVSWVLLFVPLLLVNQMTGISLWYAFIPYFYSAGIWNHLLIAYTLWALLISWVVWAIRSTLFAGRTWLAVGLGAILGVSSDWLSVLYCIEHLDRLSKVPLAGWLRMGLSILIPLIVIIVFLCTRKRSSQ